MSDANPKVSVFFRKATIWREEMEALRAIVLDSELTEVLRWRQPCYKLENENVLIIGAFKNFCVLSFFRGALLADPHGLLEQQGENTQSARVAKFTNVDEIYKNSDILAAYIEEVIKIHKAGLKVEFKESKNLTYPDELIDKLDADPEFREAFEALTPGRQRGYNLFISAAKQSQTRKARIEKNVPRILAGKGMHDR